MSIKAELHYQLKEIGYELGPFTSKDTLSVIRFLHSVVVTEQGINVAKLDDLELRKSLIQHSVIVGPITNHTRAIYQRKLLEALTNQTTEGQDDEFETNENSIQYSNLPPTKESRSAYSSENPYLQDFENVASMTIRHNYKAATSSTKSSKQNTFEESNEIRARISTKSNTILKNDMIPKKSTHKSENQDDNLKVEKKGTGSFVYVALTIIVALIVCFAYLWFEK
ncbi:unnamed protein product [Rotaria magnacalcarata]|uniref:LEM domain-containing protein n=2 Tax=Rotaria magnacalcarata TaxID=392030 RepID=A0A816E7H2_9BILA|nr:unnamed protein product [Rotaria magnacalcarata]CAF4127623.1 unnamed protein product [Rotaria magnacalcarata]